MRRAWVTAATATVVAAGCVVVPAFARAPAAEDLTALVNPLSGSLGAGFPTVGAGLPFGTVTPGPATATPQGDDPVNYVGYGYQDPSIRGFALTHFDGAGIHIGGELPTMPMTGAVTSSDPTQWSSPYSHAQETAQPGYYAVALPRWQTQVELTATPHVAVERYTFPATSGADLLFDISRDNGGVQAGSFTISDQHTVTGSVTLSGDRGFTIWFVASFDQPITATGTWLGSQLTAGNTSVSGSGAGGWVTFDTTKMQTVNARIGISYTSAAEAVANLDAEAPRTTSFDRIRQTAHDTWNRRLHAIDVTDGFADQRATFYTNLYRSMLMPTQLDDADGHYLGFDGVVRTVAAGHHHYTDLSLWDTYRTQTPLLTLTAPDVAHDVGVSLLDDTDQNHGVIPRWVHANRDYGIMGGDSGTPTLATLVADGALTGTDAQRVYADVVRQATTLPPVEPRRHLDAYLTDGYVPYDVDGIGAALTLEYAIDDAAVAALARLYGTPTDVATFTRRAESWRNLVDPSDHFLRPRNADGTWASPTTAGPVATWNPSFADGWQEGTGWQYLWLVPQDVNGLADAIGGRSTTRHRLDRFFGTAASTEAAPVVPEGQTQASFYGIYYVGNQFTPANETDLQAPWLYDWLGQPWKTQRVLHATAQVYSAAPTGLPGNDDAGTMSAWYVLAAVGLYQAQPGVDAWELSSPLFDSVTFNGTAARPRLHITADGAGPTDEYVASATLSGRALDRVWVSNAQLRGRLSYTLQALPSAAWGGTAAAAPPSISPAPTG